MKHFIHIPIARPKIVGCSSFNTFFDLLLLLQEATICIQDVFNITSLAMSWA